MAHLQEKQLTILSTMENVVVAKTKEDRIFALNITGGAKFVAVAPAPDDGSTGSQFVELDDMGLTQECVLDLE